MVESFPTIEYKNFSESPGNSDSFRSDSHLLVGLNEGGNGSVVAEIISDDFHDVNVYTT